MPEGITAYLERLLENPRLRARDTQRRRDFRPALRLKLA